LIQLAVGFLYVAGGFVMTEKPLVSAVANFPFDAHWVTGPLIGMEMLSNGWPWIMLAFALRSLPRVAAS